MDSKRIFRITDDLNYYQEWIRKISNSDDVYILGINYDQLRKFHDNISDGIAWASTSNNFIYMNYESMARYKYYTRTVKATLLHEYGHLFHNRIRRIDNRRHIVGRAGWEFLAHLWAMNKASKLGMENELLVLRHIVNQWRNDYTDKSSRNYRIAYRMLRLLGV